MQQSRQGTLQGAMAHDELEFDSPHFDGAIVCISRQKAGNAVQMIGGFLGSIVRRSDKALALEVGWWWNVKLRFPDFVSLLRRRRSERPCERQGMGIARGDAALCMLRQE